MGWSGGELRSNWAQSQLLPQNLFTVTGTVTEPVTVTGPVASTAALPAPAAALRTATDTESPFNMP